MNPYAASINQGAAQNGAIAKTITDRVHEAFDLVHQNLSDDVSRLEAIINRLMGEQPPAPETNTKTSLPIEPTEHGGTVGTLANKAHSMADVGQRLHRLVNRLNPIA